MTSSFSIALLRLVLASALASPTACDQVDPSLDDIPVFVVAAPEAFVRQVPAEGHLSAAEAMPILAPPDAREPMKIAWLADNGKAVTAGQVVVRFDNTAMTLKLADSLAAVDSAQNKAAKTSVESQVGQRRRERSARVAEQEADFAREFEADDEHIFSRMEILETGIDLELALAKTEHAQQVRRVEKRVASGQVDLIGIERQQAAHDVEQARDGLSHLEVQATNDGLFVLEQGWRGVPTAVGDTVWPGQKLAEIPLVSKMQAELFVLEADAGSVEVGQPATLVVEAHPEQQYRGTIKTVAKLATRKHPEVPVQFFAVTLELETTDPRTMNVGQRVQANIEIRHDAAVVVPRQAVFERDAKSIVYRRDGTRFEPVPVELGPSSAGKVVVTSGLAPNDTVALRDPTRAIDSTLPGESNPDSDPKGAR